MSNFLTLMILLVGLAAALVIVEMKSPVHTNPSQAMSVRHTPAR